MKTIYLDHAATSFPKAPGVGARMADYIERVGANMNRASYGPALEVGMTALSARERLCGLFGANDPACAVFTPGQTYSLNLVLSGLLQNGGHVLTSSLEHNAVMRPLNRLSTRGVTYERVPCRADGGFDLDAFYSMLRSNTRLVVMTHASNVSGALLPLCEIATACRDRGVPLLIDAAQTAGHVPIDVSSFGEYALAVPGHKGLLGPSGIGALLMSRSLAERIEPLVAGGTGSASDSEWQPQLLPDKFESGTLNLPGVCGLETALTFLSKRGVEFFATLENKLTERFCGGLAAIPRVRVLPAGNKRVGVVTCDFTDRDNAEVADALDREFGILTRCGMHCAPAAHKALGSFPQGGVRFSFGYGNAASDVDAALNAIESISKAARV